MSEERIAFPEPDEDETGPYTHLGFARARPGSEATVEKLILALVEPLRAEAGAVGFHVYRDRADPALFVIYEVFRSRADLERHVAQPYVQDFIAEIRPHVEGPLRQQFLRMLSTPPAGTE
ncbi:putative quinol monooxygenase [Pseudosporangium ferrugineum]|uniref:Quinol monooxygenase YgiN n=1 Tax=Pseudosporangium ferrugineum TaxID=439699 RepID=A0A2T0SEJ0_9ACTN|nr:putative quinol monooxygenase [Pseudosporangium ferrugineum]PRY31827.1 quinol monooxygenase YgiN [Pseudosporangium ferrugineum]